MVIVVDNWLLKVLLHYRSMCDAGLFAFSQVGGGYLHAYNKSLQTWVVTDSRLIRSLIEEGRALAVMLSYVHCGFTSFLITLHRSHVPASSYHIYNTD